MKKPHKTLFENGLIDENQYSYLEKIDTKQLFSVYFELRSLLYVGVLMLSTGIGLIIYLNMGNWAHLMLISVMLLLEVLVFWYVQKYAVSYSNEPVKPPTPYFDYVLLFGALLLISIFSYVLIRYDLLEQLLEWSSLLAAVVFFYLAFRFDHRGVLSLAITAFAAFWGLSVSPIDWADGELSSAFRLYNSSIIVGLFLYLVGAGLNFLWIKRHFVFMFKSFGLFLFMVGMLQGLSDSTWWWLYGMTSFVISFAIARKSWQRAEYLFFGLGSVSVFFAVTRFVFEFVSIDSALSFELLFLYFAASLGGFVWMIERIVNDKRRRQ